MKRGFININSYKYLIEYYNADDDLKRNQYYAEFVMLRNYNIVNNLVCDTDIYIIERTHFNKYINELKKSGKTFGNSLAFPVTTVKIGSYSSTYLKFNDNYNANIFGVNSSLYNGDELGSDVYEIYGIKNKRLYKKKIKCDKIKIYHPITKKDINAVVDITSYINNIHFHYLCKPIDSYNTKSENELKYNNESYSEYIELYFPNMQDFFSLNQDGYQTFYKEDFNIIASTRNEKFINTILSSSKDLEHSEYIDDCQIVPTNLLIQPYRIIKEIDTEQNILNTLDLDPVDTITIPGYNIWSTYNKIPNYGRKRIIVSDINDNKSSDETYYWYVGTEKPTKLSQAQLVPKYPSEYIYENKSDSSSKIYVLTNKDKSIAILDESDDIQTTYVKLYLKTNVDINNNYLSFPISIKIYPYSYIDENSKLYILDDELSQASISLNDEFKFNLMSRLGFSDGIISIVSLFEYPNKSYFYSLYKNDSTTSPIKEAYKYYNNVDDDNYAMFVNEDIQKELENIDSVESLGFETMEYVVKTLGLALKDDGKHNEELTDELMIYNKDLILDAWKNTMKDTIIKEYEEEFGTPNNFLGFKISIATDINFKHVIYTKNVRVNFGDIDDFAFKLNGIFEKWEQRPDKLIVRCTFYDRVIGVEINSNLVIITKEWFKYLINNSIYRLTYMSNINKAKGELDDMKVVELSDNNINFINTINCFINKKDTNYAVNNLSNINNKIIFKPIFYKVNNLQNIFIKKGLTQNIGINLSEYLSKVDTFKLLIENIEYVEYGRSDIFVIFNINANDISGNEGEYHILNEDSTYISSGKWTKR